VNIERVRVAGLGLLLLLLLGSHIAQAQDDRILIYMDLEQTDHLKAYGLAYWCLEQGLTVEWLLNYRGGSFLTEARDFAARAARLKGVALSVVSAGEVADIHARIEQENMEVVLLEKAPAVAIYAPPEKEPWDDAVMLAVEYAEIPYQRVYDAEVLSGGLEEYDWLHLHHEDFTGQYGNSTRAFETRSGTGTRCSRWKREPPKPGSPRLPRTRAPWPRESENTFRGEGSSSRCARGPTPSTLPWRPRV